MIPSRWGGGIDVPVLAFQATSLKAISPIDIDVTVRGLSVCLSVYLSHSCIVLKRQKISFEHDSSCLFQAALKFGLYRSTPYLPPQILPQSDPHPVDLYRRTHLIANCGRMVRDSGMMTVENL